MQPGDFQFEPVTSSEPQPIYRRRKTPWWQSPGAIIGGVLLVAAAGVAWMVVTNQPEAGTLTFTDAKKSFSVGESQPWTYRPGLKMAGVAKSSLQYELLNAPPGAAINPETGEIAWTPAEEDGPGELNFGVRVASGGLSDEMTIQISVEEIDQTPVFDSLPHPRVAPGETVEVTASANDPDVPKRTLRYVLDSTPQPGASLEEASGRFTWKVPGEISPGDYRFGITAREVDGSLSTSDILIVSVTGNSSPAGSSDPLVQALRKTGATVSLLETKPTLPQISGEGRLLRVNGGEVRVFDYSSGTALEQDAAKIIHDAAKILGEHSSSEKPPHVFRGVAELAIYDGNSLGTLAALEEHFGSPLALKTSSSSTDDPPKPETVPMKADTDIETLAALLDRERLVAKDAYPKLRKLFADRFAKEHDAVLQQAWGEDYRETVDWLNERPDVREELFIAVDPKHDRMVEAFALFNTLRKDFPEQIEAYAHLAIAVSLVWDEPSRRGVVNYAHHARRTHSQMPEDLLTAADVFRYFVEAESFMQGRAKFLPWEFLIWIVNDRTPLSERKWAVQNYLKRRSMIGKCYHDVPYDYEMLRTSSEVCQLDGKDYSLANIRQFGGVCAMQADFASRVAKSLGVPAAYVGGESRGGELHAWVMWVELLDVKPNQIQFSLESHGRYRGDKYYVGTLWDAQTGQQITDRRLERELQVVGMNPTAKRHADLAVRAMDLVAEHQELSVKTSMISLLQILKLCPGHESSWRKLAALAGAENMDREERRMMVRALESLFKTFAKFPDFTWEIFADLTRYEKDLRTKIELYQKLLNLYSAAGRPDLACDAALATAELLVEDNRVPDAVRGLSATILKFADEGRYVPKLLDRVEELYEKQGGSGADIVNFYQKLLPKIPPKRGDSPSPYAIRMYERAIECYKNNQRNDLAAALNGKLTALKAGN